MTEQGSLFGDELHEYFVLVSPDEKTKHEVNERKEKIKEIVPLSPENLRSVPHISLFKFRTGHAADDSILVKTTEALKGIKSFRIIFEGLEVYNHESVRQSLVLKIKYPDPLKQLNRALLRSLDLRPKNLLPHLTIVRAVPKHDFDKIRDHLPQLHYDGNFWCNKITILKKVVDKETSYSLLGEVKLS